MRTLVDGYNLLWAVGPLRKLMIARKSDEARRGLVALMARLVKSGRMKAPVTVVFDGRAKSSAADAAGRAGSGIEVRFAPHPDTADSVIGDLVEHGADPSGLQEEFTVVTSDREVQARVRRFGARVVGVGGFLEKHFPGQCRPRGRKRGEEPDDRPQEDESATEKPRGRLSEREIDRWLEEFGLDE